MLDKMREGAQGATAKIIIVVIILSFALAGVSSYLGGSGISVAVTVNDEEISKATVDQAYQNERTRLEQQYGEQFALLASTPNFNQKIRQQAMQTVISERLLTQAIKDMGLRIGDEQVKQEIRKMKEFQVDGNFNNEQYLSLLRRASYTPAQFSQSIKQDLARRQLLTMVLGSEFILPMEVQQANRLQAQKRVARVLTVKASDFADKDPISEQEISTYYENNSQFFQTAEQVSVDYVVLDGSLLADRVTLSSEELEKYYDMHASDYQRGEKRKVAHILLLGDNSAAKEKAQAILSELEEGADFAQLAAQKSEDSYSAENNGELDWFERGVMDPAFDDAAFKLTKEAPLSNIVKSQFGYHIIKLVDIQESKKLPLSEVTAQVENAAKREEMNNLYYELHQRLSEAAFERPDNLDEAARVLGTDIQHTELFSAAEAPEPLTDNAVLKIVFDSAFREDRMNSELIELSENKVIVVHVNRYQAAALQPLADVSEQIIAQLQAQKAHKNTEEFVKSLMVKLKAQESIETILTEKNLAFSDPSTFTRNDSELDYRVMQAVFKLAKPTEQQATYDWVTTSTDDYALIELTSVEELDSELKNVDKIQKLEERLQRLFSESTYQALSMALMANADIKYPAE
ncbi:PpiC-type peptidyl-prolyl cis-trans isomerase [Psychromonas ingrahamii 37]|uniref:Periplasmic chaperone PpiD n=1 Tax=Psychromonas ingrahamii (strain DSM 17664 / CCUG 51855 / 37) TaxID=357804 RepID=A1SUX1_PSYIN|nr:SurA N-terminal domain-containing protein [Psychromonas ingrahamii]ABM03286.1 PpiC-type peptidyl-prolyl cis-trans isomerase [Psychromonas ingrahamii 37]